MRRCNCDNDSELLNNGAYVLAEQAATMNRFSGPKLLLGSFRDTYT